MSVETKRHGRHDHKEAFCLMLYRDTAGSEEWIWNSRDGVTPFCATSPAGHEAQHVEWRRDLYAPDHAPRVGDRIFVDLTADRAREIATRRVAAWWDHSEYPMRDRYQGETQEQVAERIARDIARDGAPDIATVTEQMAVEFARHGVDRHPGRRPAAMLAR